MPHSLAKLRVGDGSAAASHQPEDDKRADAERHDWKMVPDHRTKSDAESPKNMKSVAATKRTLPMTVGSRQGHTGEIPDTGIKGTQARPRTPIDCQQLCAPVYR